jgi:sugar (pentulose or hexulose) kinase
MMSGRGSDSAWVGVDLGTQSVRAMLVSEAVETFLRLVDELSQRGWLSRAVAQHARRRAGA